MNSSQRRQARYARRQIKRKQNKQQVISNFDSFEKIFSFQHLLASGFKCCNGVRWKASVQRFELRILTNTARQQARLQNGTWKPKAASHFLLFDAGKLRQIDSVNIYTRVVQRTLCVNCLIPLSERIAIPDNYASRPNKGTDYAIGRFKMYLSKAPSSSYLALFDFSKFFASIEHAPLISIIEDNIKDAATLEIIHKIFKLFGKRGLQLGSHFSQSGAVLLCSYLDIAMKQQHTLGYGRYSDDGFIFAETYEQCEFLLSVLANKAADYGLTLNTTKTMIVEVSGVIRFLQKRFKKTDSGCYIRISQKSIVKARRRCKRLFKLYDDGRMPLDAVLRSYNTWVCFAAKYSNNAAVKNLNSLVKSLLEERNISYETKRHYMLELSGEA